MSCECKDENGSLLDKCLGTCKSFQWTIQNEIYQMKIQIGYLIDQINSLPEKTMRMFRESYAEGFKNGFESGFESGRDN